MRLFIACTLPEGFVRTLTAAQGVLAEQAGSIRLTRKEQLHLTLRFIGEMGDGMVHTIAGWFKAFPDPGAEALRFHPAGYGAFASGEGLLIWSGLSPRPVLHSHVSRLEKGLRSLGLPPDTRQWLPHVTLARRAVLRDHFRDTLPLLPQDKQAYTLGEPVLFKSEFTPGGVRYTPI